jgi:hypothetical protein
MQPMRRLNLRLRKINFYLFLVWGFGKDFFCSQCVPKDLPNIIKLLSHMFCPRFNFHIYELKGAKGKHLYACPMFQKEL